MRQSDIVRNGVTDQACTPCCRTDTTSPRTCPTISCPVVPHPAQALLPFFRPAALPRTVSRFLRPCYQPLKDPTHSMPCTLCTHACAAFTTSHPPLEQAPRTYILGVLVSTSRQQRFHHFYVIGCMQRSPALSKGQDKKSHNQCLGILMKGAVQRDINTIKKK